jgi:hypothetical protein
MIICEIYPQPNTVQYFVKYMVDIGQAGRDKYFFVQLFLFSTLTTLLLFSLFLSTQKKEPNKITRLVLGDRIFILFLITFVIFSRVPLIVQGFQNTDEAMWVAIAKTFIADPRYWVRVDGGTGGPIVPILLVFLKAIGLPIDFGTLKLMTGVIMGVSAGILYVGLADLTSSLVAKFTAFFLATTCALMVSSDMIAYNSEHPVILLLSIAVLFLGRIFAEKGKQKSNIIALGITLGLIPFAKLQGAPIALVLGLFGCVLVYWKATFKDVLFLIGSATGPTLLVLFLVSLYGGLGDFWTEYFVYNIMYTSQAAINGWHYKLQSFIEIIFIPADLKYFIKVSLVIGALGLPLLFFSRLSKVNKVKIVSAIILFMVTSYCIMAPGRLFPHYVLLILVPLTIGIAFTVHSIFELVASHITSFSLKHLILRYVFALTFLFWPVFSFAQNFSLNPEYLEISKAKYDGYSPQGDVAVVLKTYYTKGAKMAIWGWATELWESTPFQMGTRDGNTAWMIYTRLRDQLAKRHISDLQVNQPEVYVEAIAPNFFGFSDRSSYGIQIFPEIANYINEHYNLEAEVGGARIFIRKGYLRVKPTYRVLATRKPTTSEFHANMEEFLQNGSFLQFKGWSVIGGNSDNQKVMLGLVNNADTVLLETYQLSNKGIVDFSPNNKGNLMCGFWGLIPFKEIPEGDFQVGLRVEDENTVGFKMMGLTFNKNKFSPLQ